MILEGVSGPMCMHPLRGSIKLPFAPVMSERDLHKSPMETVAVGASAASDSLLLTVKIHLDRRERFLISLNVLVHWVVEGDRRYRLG